MDYLFFFIIGAVIGSFLNVCIYRIPRNISIVKPNSFCPNCSASIAPYHNIPLVSYVMLRGRCANCHQPISVRYFLVEAFTACLTVFSYHQFGLSPAFFFYLILIYFLVMISFIDLSIKLIYNRILIYLLVFGVVFNLLFPVRNWSEAIGGLFAGSCSLLFFAVLGHFLFKKESMGMGDVKLAAVIGFFLGWKMVLLALLVGFIYAVVTAMIIGLVRNIRVPKYIPMAPFFTGGALTFLYWGPKILNWYWNLFFPVNG